MKTSKLNIFVSTLGLLMVIILFHFFTANKAYAEGTKEIMPYDTCIGRLNIGPTLSPFAYLGSGSDYRLHIHIENIGEKIYFGFGRVLSALQNQITDLKYVIKDPLGNVVYGQNNLPTASYGFINTYQQAINGPNIINPLGYSPMQYTPTMVGDHYIEFYYQTSGGYGSRREIEFFDITVTNSLNTPIKGRVWSKEWQFTVGYSVGANAYENPFYGQMYMYSNDSIVTTVDFNGMRPLVFTLTANSTGTANTGNILNDRKSVSGKSTYPEFKIFLNDPDSIVYPSGIQGAFIAPMSFSGCPDDYCINVHTSKSTSIQLLIDLNGIYGYQAGTEDVLIIQNVGAGSSCIAWDGLNGLGQDVMPGTVIKLYITMAAGLTHMPIYDAEHNPNGFKIDIVRPTNNSTQFYLYWDDSNIPNSVPAPSGGCVSSSGCHYFPLMFGDQNTINTWWYANSNIKDSLEVTFNGMVWDNIISSNPICANINNGVLIANVLGGTPPYTYHFNNSIVSSSFNYNNLGVGTYIFSATDANNCILTDSISLVAPPQTFANFISIPDTCGVSAGSLSTVIQSGNGPFQYLWNTAPTDTLSFIQQVGSGLYTITITDSYNCSYIFSDSVLESGTLLQYQDIVLHDTCGNGQGSIQVLVSNGNPPLVYQWSSNPTININTITNLTAGSYSVTITDSTNCNSINNYQIIDMPAPVPDFIIPPDICINSAVNVQYNGNQVPPDSFVWNFPEAQILGGATVGPYSILYNNTGIYTVSLYVNKIGCPADSATKTVTVHKAIINIDSLNHVNCFNGMDGYIGISLSDAISPYTIYWNNIMNNNLTDNQLSSGNYQIIVSDAISCTDTIDTFIQQPNKLIANISAIDASCSYSMDGIINASANGGTRPYKYRFENLDLGLDSVFTNLSTGTHQVFINDTQGCKDSVYIPIGFTQDILADFNAYSSTYLESAGLVDFSFTGFGAANYFWDFGDNSYNNFQNPSHLYSDIGNQQVELMVNSGPPYNCWDTIVKMIEVESPFKIFVPNAFSPNNDGLNDLFTPIAFRLSTYQMNIYNRYGELLYTTYSLDKGWDGTFKSKKMTMGVYTYLIILETEDGRAFKKAGTFTLLL